MYKEFAKLKAAVKNRGVDLNYKTLTFIVRYQPANERYVLLLDGYCLLFGYSWEYFSLEAYETIISEIRKFKIYAKTNQK